AKLTHVTYVYGDELGRYEGRVKQAYELAEMAAEYGEFRAYVVEVCQSCGWNHLASSYVLGTGEPRARRGRPGSETRGRMSVSAWRRDDALGDGQGREARGRPGTTPCTARYG